MTAGLPASCCNHGGQSHCLVLPPTKVPRLSRSHLGSGRVARGPDDRGAHWDLQDRKRSLHSAHASALLAAAVHGTGLPLLPPPSLQVQMQALQDCEAPPPHLAEPDFVVLGGAVVEVGVPAGLACRAEWSGHQHAGQWFDTPDMRHQG